MYRGGLVACIGKSCTSRPLAGVLLPAPNTTQLKLLGAAHKG